MLGCRVLPGDAEGAANITRFVEEELARWKISPLRAGNKILITSDRGSNVSSALTSPPLVDLMVMLPCMSHVIQRALIGTIQKLDYIPLFARVTSIASAFNMSHNRAIRFDRW